MRRRRLPCSQLPTYDGPNKSKRDEYSHILKRTLRKERRQKSNVSWNRDDIATIVDHLWDGCCAISGVSENLVLCRWNNNEPLSISNHVCLCSPLAKSHSYVTNPVRYYGTLSNYVLLRLNIAESVVYSPLKNG